MMVFVRSTVFLILVLSWVQSASSQSYYRYKERSESSRVDYGKISRDAANSLNSAMSQRQAVIQELESEVRDLVASASFPMPTGFWEVDVKIGELGEVVAAKAQELERQWKSGRMRANDTRSQMHR